MYKFYFIFQKTYVKCYWQFVLDYWTSIKLSDTFLTITKSVLIVNNFLLKEIVKKGKSNDQGAMFAKSCYELVS